MVSRRHLLKLSALGTASFAAPLAYSASEMTMSYNTGNPIGSTNPKDLSDNAKCLDRFANGPECTYKDRLGVARISVPGMIAEFETEQTHRGSTFLNAQDERSAQFTQEQQARGEEFNRLIESSGYSHVGNYAPGLVIERHNQYITYEGHPYRLSSFVAVPHVTTGNWEVESDAFVLLGDDVLRQELAVPSVHSQQLGYPLGRAPSVHTNTVLMRVKDAGSVGLKGDFGAKGNGSALDTNAFNQWWDCLLDASYKRVIAQPGEKNWMLQKGPFLQVEDGTFLYDGPGLNLESGQSFVMALGGIHSLVSKIVLVNDAYLFDLDNNPVRTYMGRLTVNGGLGAARLKSKARMVSADHFFEALVLSRFKECGISNNSVDMPYFRVDRCDFYGHPEFNAMGACVSGFSAGGFIQNSVFTDLKYGIKLAVGDNGVERNGPATPFSLFRNDFYRSGARPGQSNDLWIEPGSTTNNAGRAITLIANKFGQESLRAGDSHILIADSLANAGANLNGDRQHSTAKSSGFVSGLRATENNVNSQGNGSVRVPYIRSFTPNVGNLKIDDLFDNGMPSHVVEFAGGIVQTEITALARTNVFVANGLMALQENSAPALLSNLRDVFKVIDPLGMLAGHPQIPCSAQSDQRLNYIHLYAGTTASAPAVGASKVAINNSYGGTNEAVEVALTAADGRLVATAPGGIEGRMTWIDCELRRGSSASVQSVVIEILDSTGNVLQLRRSVILDSIARWQKVVIPYVPNVSGNILVRFKSNEYEAGVSTNFIVGNVNVYINESPINTGHNGGISMSWSKQHVVEGGIHYWLDAAGNRRAKRSPPASETDGVVVSANLIP